MSDLHVMDPEAEEAAKAAEHAARVRSDDLKWLMSDKRGRRFVHRLLEDTGVYQSSFSSDPLFMSFREGSRQIGLRTLAEVVAECPTSYALMLTEKAPA